MGSPRKLRKVLFSAILLYKGLGRGRALAALAENAMRDRRFIFELDYFIDSSVFLAAGCYGNIGNMP